MLNRELLQQALDALEQYKKYTRGVMIPSTHCTGNAAITALREALAAPQAEPVAWMSQGGTAVSQSIVDDMDDEERYLYPIPLYAAPPAAPAPVVPLTDEQIIELRVQAKGDYKPWSESIAFARAIEKAHGIGTTGGAHG